MLEANTERVEEIKTEFTITNSRISRDTSSSGELVTPLMPIYDRDQSTDDSLKELSEQKAGGETKTTEERSSYIYNLPSKIDQYDNLGGLKELGDVLEQSPYQVGICGEEGSGKTVLALEYCLKRSGKYSFIIWCQADDPEVLYYNYYKFCLAIGLIKIESETESKKKSNKNDKRAEVTHESLKKEIKDYLTAKITDDDTRRCLFVYDDYNGPGDLKDYLIDVKNRSIIIVSRVLRPEMKMIKTLENKFDDQQLSMLITVSLGENYQINFPLKSVIEKCHRNPMLVCQTIKIIVTLVEKKLVEGFKDHKDILQIWEKEVPPSYISMPVFNFDFYTRYLKISFSVVELRYFLYFISFFRPENVPISFFEKWIKSFLVMDVNCFEDIRDQIFDLLNICSILAIDSIDDRYCRLSHHGFKHAIQNEFKQLSIEERHVFFIRVFDFIIKETQGNNDIYMLFLHMLEADLLYQVFLNDHNKILQIKNKQYFQRSILQRIILLRYISEIYYSLRLDTQVSSLIDQIKNLSASIRNVNLFQKNLTFEEGKISHLSRKINKSNSFFEIKQEGSLTSAVDVNPEDDGSGDYQLLTELDQLSFSYLDSTGFSNLEFHKLLKEVEQYELSYLSLLNFNLIDEKIRCFFVGKCFKINLPRISEIFSLLYNQLKNFVFIFTAGILIYEFSSFLKKEASASQKLKSLFYLPDDSFQSSDELTVFLGSWQAVYLELLLGEPLYLFIPVSFFILRCLNNNYNKLFKDINNQLNVVYKSKTLETISTLLSFNPLIININLFSKLMDNKNNFSVDQRIAAFNFLKKITTNKQCLLKLKAIEQLASFDNFSLGYLIKRYENSSIDFEGSVYIKIMSIAYLKHLSTMSPGTCREYFPKYYASFWLLYVGKANDSFKNKVLFILFKILGFIKFCVEIFLFYKITCSIIKAIACPDKDGFFYENVSFPWASDYPENCFGVRINFFRNIDSNESVLDLVYEIDQYNLGSLTDLSLSFKSLTTEEASILISAVVSHGAVLLRLDLSGNRLDFLNKTLFVGLGELRLLNLSHCHIKELVSSDFAYFPYLEELYLSSNDLAKIDADIFYNLPRLKTLVMSSTNWSIFDESIFYQLYNLEFIDLSSGRNEQNLLGKSGNLFKNLKKLKSLYLGNSNLSVLNADLFNGLYSLEILDLSENTLSDFNFTYVSSLHNLVELYLDNNIGLNLSLDIFSQMQQLNKLNLKNLSLNHTELIDIFSILPKTLTDLNIVGNSIDFSAPGLVFPPYLNTLVIGDNSFIPVNVSQGWMQNFPKSITSFSILEAKIESLDPYTFRNFSQLTELDLSHNRLSFMYNNTFYDLDQLDTLILGVNRIYGFEDEVFGKLPSLRQLHLGDNKLENVYDVTFSKLIHLKILDLGRNHFRYINENVFLKLSDLENLILEGNLLRDISSTLFSRLGKLSSLDMSSNYLGDQTTNILMNLPNQLTYLDISDNLLTNYALELLAEAAPCNSLISVEYSKNLGRTTNLTWQLQVKSLKNTCEDHLCHVNLPILPVCFVEPYPLGDSEVVLLSSYSSALPVNNPTSPINYTAFLIGALTFGLIGLMLVKAGLKSIFSVCQTTKNVSWCHLFKSLTPNSTPLQLEQQRITLTK